MILPHAHEEDVHDEARYTLAISLCCSLLCMYTIRAAHNKFVLPLKSLAIRFSAAICIVFGASIFTTPINFVRFCFCMVGLNFVLDYVFVHYLTWEIDEEFMASLETHKMRVSTTGHE